MGSERKPLKENLEGLLNDVRKAWIEKGYPTLSETKSDQQIIRNSLYRYLRWIKEDW